MSHTVKAETKVTDLAILQQICHNLGLPDPEEGVHNLYSGNKAQGYAVKLPGWNYPAVFNLETGEVQYDNYNGSWGKQEEMDRLLHGYAHEFVAREFHQLNGLNINEYVDAEGWTVMECEVEAAV